MLTFPNIDPVALHLGPFGGEDGFTLAIRWYGLAYVAGILLGWRWMLHLAKKAGKHFRPTVTETDDFLTWAVLGVILGGRLGYVVLYDPAMIWQRPMEIGMPWLGGMSFHGGLIGVISALALFSRRRGIPFLAIADLTAVATPIGLFFGRIANFVNGELWGRPSDAPWAMIFPNAEPAVPRHPSQLYEAVCEGVLLFLILAFVANRIDLRQRRGLLSGLFLFCYGLFRILLENFREIDVQVAPIFGLITIGQAYSLPMLAGGLWLIHLGLREKTPQHAA